MALKWDVSTDTSIFVCKIICLGISINFFKIYTDCIQIIDKKTNEMYNNIIDYYAYLYAFCTNFDAILGG